MGKSCGPLIFNCLGGYYYSLDHPNVHYNVFCVILCLLDVRMTQYDTEWHIMTQNSREWHRTAQTDTEQHRMDKQHKITSFYG